MAERKTDMNNIFSRFFVFSATFLIASVAFAADGAMSPETGKNLAAGIGLGLAVLGAAMGQGRAAAAAFEGIGRNPSAAKPIFTPFIIGLALMESLVLLALLGLKLM